MWEKLISKGKLNSIESKGYRIDILGPISLPRQLGGREVIFNWYPFLRIDKQKVDSHSSSRFEDPRYDQLSLGSTVNSLLTYGEIEKSNSPLVRVHSCCATGDIFGSMRCDCSSQLELSIQKIVQYGVGAVVYMAGHEGRGIGLWAKGAAYLLQDEGFDTYDANRALNLPEDSRDFTDAALVLRHTLKTGAKVKLLTNNVAKIEALRN
jgi:GTP cyclohydrolase II